MNSCGKKSKEDRSNRSSVDNGATRVCIRKEGKVVCDWKRHMVVRIKVMVTHSFIFVGAMWTH